LNSDVFDHQPQELLAAVEVECVDAGQGVVSEVGDASVELVVGG
jgi:hypothetical protein